MEDTQSDPLRACDMVCRRAEERIAELDDQRVVLYVAVGEHSHKRLPFKHIRSPPNHVTVTLSFETHVPGAPPVTPAITRDEWGDDRQSLRLGTNGGLPVEDNGDFYTNGSLMRLLDKIVTEGGGAAVLLFAETLEFGATSTPAVFRYIHIANAIYQRMKNNEWSTVLDGKRGAHLRALMLFGAPTAEPGTMAFDMMFPTRYGCQRTYIRNLGDIELSDNFSRLWFYAACDAGADPRVSRCRQLAGGAAGDNAAEGADEPVAEEDGAPPQEDVAAPPASETPKPKPKRAEKTKRAGRR